MKQLKMLGFALGILSILGVPNASAVPAFARKYGVSCTACHVAWPVLNEHGRQFKMNGYRQERDETAGAKETKEIAGIKIPEKFPLSAVIKARPYDKDNNKDYEFRSRAFHEFELFVAEGGIGSDLSFFGEIEMEDEADGRVVKDSAGGDVELGPFTPILGSLQAGWHPKEWGNVVVGHRSFFAMDPYQTLAGNGTNTVAKRLVPQEGQPSGHSLDAETQTIMAYGEVGGEGMGSLYYAAGMTTDPNDSEGQGGKDGNVRLAFDTMKGVMVGAFASQGTTGKVTRAMGPNRFTQSRMGVDMLVEAGGLNVRGAGVYFYDAAHGSNAHEVNRGGYIEAFYPIKLEGAPMLVPTLRQEYITKTDGRDDTAYLTMELVAYLKPNVKSLIEYSAQTAGTAGYRVKAPADGLDHRWVAQLEFGF